MIDDLKPGFVVEVFIGEMVGVLFLYEDVEKGRIIVRSVHRIPLSTNQHPFALASLP